MIGVLRLRFESAGVESAPFNLWAYLETGIICVYCALSRARDSKIEQWPPQMVLKACTVPLTQRALNTKISPMLFLRFPPSQSVFMYSVTHRGFRP